MSDDWKKLFVKDPFDCAVCKTKKHCDESSKSKLICISTLNAKYKEILWGLIEEMKNPPDDYEELHQKAIEMTWEWKLAKNKIPN